MSTNPYWTPIKFTVLSSMPNCSDPSSSHLKYAKYWLLSLPPSDTYLYRPIDLSLPLLDRWHWSAIPSTLFLCWTNCLKFDTRNQYPGARTCLEKQHKTTWPFSVSFEGLPFGSYPTFKGPLISLAKTPLKCLVSCLLTFQKCHFKLPMGPRSSWYLWK